MFTTLIVFQVLLAVGLIAIVLVQRGPGATMGAAFGSGASGTVFGSRGAGNFLTRTTGWLALGFFAISLALAVLAAKSSDPASSGDALSGSVIEQAEQQPAPAEPNATDAALQQALDSLDQAASSSAADSGDEAAAPAAEPPAAEDAASAEAAAAADPEQPPVEDPPSGG